jgi:hypothetical protein
MNYIRIEIESTKVINNKNKWYLQYLAKKKNETLDVLMLITSKIRMYSLFNLMTC